jgi:hypothetical protein
MRTPEIRPPQRSYSVNDGIKERSPKTIRSTHQRREEQLAKMQAEQDRRTRLFNIRVYLRFGAQRNAK